MQHSLLVDQMQIGNGLSLKLKQNSLLPAKEGFQIVGAILRDLVQLQLEIVGQLLYLL